MDFASNVATVVAFKEIIVALQFDLFHPARSIVFIALFISKILPKYI